jgi:cyclic beta-1,2-glucan synthetase
MVMTVDRDAPDRPSAPPDTAPTALSSEEPIRAELFGLEHLEAHARGLSHAWAAGGKGLPGDPLLRRFRENGRALTRAHAEISAAAPREPLGADAEWLLDNYHIIEQTLQEVRHDLPRGFYHELPVVTEGPFLGLPRVYALSVELIAHTDSSLDETNITRFVQAYQAHTPLTTGELWAVPTMLRVGLLENLRRLAGRMLHTRAERQMAERWAQHLLARHTGTGRPGPEPWPTGPETWTDPCVVRVLEGLRERGLEASAGLEWLEEAVARCGCTAADVLRRENGRQAANQVSVGNCVTSLRLLGNLDWAVFFERTSAVEALLRTDPAGVYARQDFATRDRYRRAVERVSRGSGHGEPEVARRALALSAAAAPAGVRRHVGYFLVGAGRPELEAGLGYRPRVRAGFVAAMRRHPNAVYFGSFLAVTGLLLAGALAYAGAEGGSPLALVVVAAAVLLPVSDLAVGLVHHVLTLLLPPRVLPKMDFKEGIPEDYTTFVVMPTMLSGPHSGAELADRLEVHYLSNPDPRLYFALLTDFSDAPSQTRPEDEGYVRDALGCIRALNARYADGGPDRFYLCHRRRVWDPVQECWMGWERKRGKLSEFNRLLRGASDTTYAVVSGDVGRLPRVRFVITLDADTRLPRESARRLVGTLAHPLNRPHFDPEKGRVVSGYGVLQPRVSFDLLASARSLFARLLTGSAGLDPYTTAVSDVYQDLFGRGTYTGKGIYDVDAFEAAVGHTFPDNHILSHDLIEGNYARCGLVTDIELLDDFPARYHAYARREHRWVRGDWQLLPWLLPSAPTGGTPARRPNPLPALERWKVLDNLRRSLVPPALVALFVLGWTILPGSAWLWTGLALSVLALPLLLSLLGGAADLLGGGSWSLRLHNLRTSVGATTGQFLLGVAFLAEQARLSLDAVGRTLYRLAVSRKHLLEWETAASTERRLGTGLVHFWSVMWPAAALAVTLGALVFFVRPGALPASAPLLTAWLLSPAVAWWVSRPRRERETPLGDDERRELRRVARKTWHFFETFVGPDDHWLPPDNHQEDPGERVAHRTSPTNMGLYLLSALAAHDFGYLSLAGLATRLERAFDTFDRLERFHGHFHNWYDTRTLAVLPTPYVSTVDSGNLLASLLALRQGLREKANAPHDPATARAGLTDTLRLVAEALRGLEPPPGSPRDVFRPLEEAVRELDRLLVRPMTDDLLGQLDAGAARLVERLKSFAPSLGEEPEELLRWVQSFASQVSDFRAEAGAADLPARLRRLDERAGAFAAAMDFALLYNRTRHLFSVGYNRGIGRLDSVHYDLLASEASLTSFLAVARGDVPRQHWFQLGRQLVHAAGGVALVSWGGTMFEYLMPRLFFRDYAGTLLDASWRGAVDRQIEYGRQRGVPWGISESGFYALDRALDYQYQSFGVPGLGLKRGLAQSLVITPYATALALMVRPHAALANLRALAAERGEGAYGYYEAIDYTREHFRDNRRRSAVVRQYMAHHQGMGLLALANALLGEPLTRRFHAEPMVRATELLLQERLPHAGPVTEVDAREPATPPAPAEHATFMNRRLTNPDTPHPIVHLLSNGQYTVMVTNAGGGGSAWRDLAVTRWREDRTRDAWGQFLYVRDTKRNRVWSATHQPVGTPADAYEVVFSADKAEFRRRDRGIESLLEITVSPENAAEVRRLTLTNLGPRPRELEVTSYAEPVLLPPRADLAHPAFGKLFLETEFLPAESALLCRRRPRAADQQPLWAVHVLAVDGPPVGPVEYETDRARFLGRGRTYAAPAALDPGARLSGTTGPVLDPVFSLRRRVRVAPGASVSLTFTTAVATTREEALALADQYHDVHGTTRAFELAWAHSQVQLRHLRLSPEEMQLYGRLAAHVIYAGPALRAPQNVLAANRQGPPGLWRHGISGDQPIVLVGVGEGDELEIVRQLLQAHAYWRLSGLQADLVILNEHPTSYLEQVQQQLQDLVRASDSHGVVDQPGGVFLRKADTLSDDDRVLLLTAARVVLAGNRGSLAAQVEGRERPTALPPQLAPLSQEGRGVGGEALLEAPSPPSPLPRGERGDGLLFDNGLGGFTPDGREYVVRLTEQALPPAPWINVIANEGFGFLVSEAGCGYTWAGNSQMNRLTPWSNDPVSDPPGEVVYLRDEDSGAVWTPTPLPLWRGACRVRHGQGYTLFESGAPGLAQEVLLFVPTDDPVKVVRLRLRNTGQKARRLSATLFAAWVLGTVREDMAPFVVTEEDADTGALLARNAYNSDFGNRIAFADVSQRPRSFTADRTEFLGRNGSAADPAALGRTGLSGATGAGLDPCAALMAPFELRPGEEKEIVFFLGQAENVDEARRLVRNYSRPEQVGAALEAVRRRWDKILGAVQVRTPDPAMDLLLNRWLLYQVLACRVWARSAFYQSSGAYGFRDQLQDVMALVYAAPAEARAHVLRAARRQFLEGDVQHWWHPPANRGVRTRFSDDFLWLPFVVAHYVATTGDRSLLDERVPFLRAPQLRPEQEEEYGLPELTEETGSVYDHCLRAIENGFRYGSHGLPLMGIGDWNDGMNRVGAGGKGESVWDAWFQIAILRRFADIAEARGEQERAREFRQPAERLRVAVEEQAWDGRWYRRAYFDDGTPLGSAENDECRIDSLPQTWAVLSGAADPERARQGMAAVDEMLVKQAEKLILLFTPPFDRGKLQPGYIKGYVPGIRENGGQYTHAATWVVQATALLGQGSRAVALFDLVNPIHHSATAEAVVRYKVEPYVVAADIYGVPPHVGRGGWTWYTGSAGWLYRAGLETILGFRLEGDRLWIEPCIPASWPGYAITYRRGSATYYVRVDNPHGAEHGVGTVTLDGQPCADGIVPLTDDGRTHEVVVTLGEPNMADQKMPEQESDRDRLVSRPADALPTKEDPAGAHARGAPADPKPAPPASQIGAPDTDQDDLSRTA